MENNTTKFKLKSAESFTCTKLDGSVELRLGDSGLAAVEPVTLPEFFRTCCERYRSRPAIAFKEQDNCNKHWTKLTFSEYATKVEQVALMLIHIGLQHRETIGILAHNRPEWFYSHFGVLRAGGIVFGIYPTSSPDAILHMLRITGASICIVDSAEQVAMLRCIREKLPKLRAVVQLDGSYENPVDTGLKCYRWSELMKVKYGDNLREELKCREKNVFPNECALLVFTSGTTGMPKGVLLSHDNVIFNVKSIYSHKLNVNWSDGRIVSYLPLSHIAAESFEILSSLFTGACVYFAERDALRGTLINTLLEVKPTVFLGVPRIYEKLAECLLAEQNRKGALSKILVNKARDAVVMNKLCEQNCEVSVTLKDTLANYILENTRKVIGMEHCKIFFGSGAPFTMEMKAFFQNFDVHLIDIYGLSELAGGGTMNNFNWMENTVGKALPGTELSILKRSPDDKQGEILFRGRHVFMGYLNQPRQTKSTIDENGWFHTGDIGHLNKDGCLVNSGRIKEIIITSGGENVAPLPIEEAMKRELPALSNAMLVGDQRKYLTILLTIKTVINPITGLQTDELHEDAVAWLKSLHLNIKSLSVVLATLKNPKKSKISMKIMKSITEAIDRVNARALSRAQRVQKFLLLCHDFTVATGELSPSLKVRRSIVLKKYAKKIDDMYQ